MKLLQISSYLQVLLPLVLLILPITLTNAACGSCEDCTDEILDTLAGEYTCGARIAYLQSDVPCGNLSELDACRRIAGVEFPWPCGPACDPDRCNTPPSPVTPYPTQTPPPASSLYCFPAEDTSRVTYSNVWNDFTVQVKEGASCGPGANRFTRNTVSLSDGGDELTMEFKKVDDNWEASEVRVFLPNEGQFNYGEYTFNVKSVEVIDTVTGDVTSTVLPKDLVLGLFTWDPTEKYSETNPQNWNHEVDIEISRWNGETNSDVQFLMQPPESPQMYRFYSGDENTYDQSNHSYSFNWLPGGISWASTAGGGEAHEYTVENAVLQGRRDYVQCLPANIEIRLNLWNMFGSNAPNGLSDTEYVKVVIDRFEYVESSVSHVEDGGYCSKHCQCVGNCLNGKCEATPASCVDSPLGYGKRQRLCTWVADDPVLRCSKKGVDSHCPNTCGTCSTCVDATKKWWLTAEKKRKCKWASKRLPDLTRCEKPGVKETCRKTCGVCQ